MLVVVSSPAAVAPNNVPRPDVVATLIAVANLNYPVCIISNHAQPFWFQQVFGGSNVQFLQWPGRQSGEVLRQNAAHFQSQPHDVVVLAATLDDIQMGKNGGAVIVAAGWSQDKAVQGLGVCVDSGQEFYDVLALTASWQGAWWYWADAPIYSVRALADLSSIYGQNVTQQMFADKVKNTAKHGGSRLKALLTVTARSLLTEGVSSVNDLLWGVYPSSKSANNDTEVLSDFFHRLRTISSRVQFAKKGEPLFIRHTHSPKRSAGAGGNRTDPTSQIETICLNPFYKKGRLVGRHVIVLDDCTTYGVSFGVAAAFLRTAGAKSVTGVALGKFGNCLNYYQIELKSDPFAPIKKGGYQLHPTFPFNGFKNVAAKQALQQLIV